MAVIARVLYFFAGFLCIPVTFTALFFIYGGYRAAAILPGMAVILFAGLIFEAVAAVKLWKRTKAFAVGFLFFLITLAWTALRAFQLKDHAPDDQTKVSETSAYEK